MKKIYTLLFTLSLSTVSIQAAIKHKIKSGETLTSIAQKHQVSITKLRKANGIEKGHIIRSGAFLTIPAKRSKETYSNYSIKKGDTLTSIAASYKTTIYKLRKINGIQKGQPILIGETLKVPQSSLKLTKTTKVAKKKETLFKVDDIFASVDKKELAKCSKLITDAKKKLGKKYVWGASGTGNTYDCSSFTKYVYRKNGITIPRTSIMQSRHGQYVKRKDLQKGDLVFFDTSKERKGYVNHVGIYLGDNKFIHASSAKKKVVISSLSKFYGQRYKGARRPS